MENLKQINSQRSNSNTNDLSTYDNRFYQSLQNNFPENDLEKIFKKLEYIKKQQTQSLPIKNYKILSLFSENSMVVQKILEQIKSLREQTQLFFLQMSNINKKKNFLEEIIQKELIEIIQQELITLLEQYKINAQKFFRRVSQNRMKKGLEKLTLDHYKVPEVVQKGFIINSEIAPRSKTIEKNFKTQQFDFNPSNEHSKYAHRNSDIIPKTNFEKLRQKKHNKCLKALQELNQIKFFKKRKSYLVVVSQLYNKELLTKDQKLKIKKLLLQKDNNVQKVFQKNEKKNLDEISKSLKEFLNKNG